MYGRLPTEVDPDYLELVRMSKYSIYTRPDSPPFKCANCGANKDDGRKYVDFMCHVDWYGDVILCTLCIRDIASAVGMPYVPEYQIIAARSIESLEQQGKELYQRVTETFEAFRKFYADIYALGVKPDPDPSPVADPDLPEGTEGSGEKNPESGEAERKSTEQTSSSGREDIPRLTDLLGL